MTTVLIVDDHPTFRATARMLLGAEGYDVVGEAPDGTSGIAAAGELHPDLVLLDVNLPDLDGFSVAQRITGKPGAPAGPAPPRRAASSSPRAPPPRASAPSWPSAAPAASSPRASSPAPPSPSCCSHIA